MGYSRFLTDLFEDGRVVVAEFRPISPRQLREGDEVLSRFEHTYRRELPAPVPGFRIEAARWAACRFFRACQLAVFRDLPAETVDKELSGSFRSSLTPEDHYSVDLVFRYLPDVTRFARSAAEADPLIQHLQRWSQTWPLSSVGMPDVGEVGVDGFSECPSLLRLYADRVIATGDVTRLADPCVREVVRASLGMHTELAPAIAKALQAYEVKEPTS